MALNLLDRAIGYVAPRTALRRAQARTAMARMQRLYDGAQSGRRTEGWVTTGADATSEAMLSRPVLRHRARDLVRNNPWAPNGIRRYASAIGGMTPRAKHSDPQVAKAADALFKLWAPWADAAGVTNFRGLETQILRALPTDGELLIQKVPRSPKDGLPVPLQIRVLEIDHLDETRDASDERKIGGIQFDQDWRRKGYKLRTTHPGAAHIGERRTVPVPATDLLHVFEPQRPGALFGVSWLAPAIQKLRDIDLLDEAEIVRQQAQSCIAGFVETSDPEGTLTGDPKPEDAAKLNAQKRLIEGFSPGMWVYGAPGETVKFNSPSGPAGSEANKRLELLAVSAALGMPYELFTGDMSQVSFISGRLGTMPWRQRVKEVQDTILVPQALDEIWDWFVFYAQLAGKLPMGETIGVEWAPPLMESAQPVDDATEELIRIRSGTMTLFDALARRGYDPEAKLAEMKQIAGLLDAAGLVLDSDPRKVSKGGQAQQGEAAQASAARGAEMLGLLRTLGMSMDDLSYANGHGREH